MTNTTVLLMIGVVCALFGAALGAGVVLALRSPRSNELPADPDLEPILKVWRDPRRSDLVVEVAGKQARSPRDLDNDQAHQAAQLVQMLRLWLGVDAPAPQTPAPTPEKDNRPAASSAPVTRKLNLNPVDLLSKAVSAEVGKPNTAPKSIAAQIDEILQEKLEGSPLEQRAIRLMELPQKGMVVMIGLEQYEGIDQVPDEAIRAVIRQAVAEWERRVGS